MNSDASQGFNVDDDDSDSASNTSNEINHQQTYPWSNYSIPQLRELLRQRGQLTTGSKSVLKKRLKNLDRAAKPETPAQQTTTINMASQNSTQVSKQDATVRTEFKSEETKENEADSKRTRKGHPLRSRITSRSNSFSAHFTDFINRRRIALETERQEISVYTSPLTVLSYFVLYLLHEIRMLLVWIVSQQYLLVVLPLLAAVVYFVYQTDGAHRPLLKHAESGLIWYGYWTLLGVASSIGLGTGLHTFILFLGPHIAEVTLTAYKCGNTDFDVRGDHRYICKSPESVTIPLAIYSIFKAVQWESFFWGLGTALGELPPYFVARAAALSGNRNEELAAIEDLLKKKPDSVSYKERILLMVHEGMKRLGFFGIFLCASIPNPLFDLAGITCGHFLVPFSTFFGATFFGKAVVKSSIQTLFVIFMFSADTLAAFMGWLEQSFPFIHGYLADGINSQKGALHGEGRLSEDELENSTSLVSLIWNTVIFIMISYFLLSIVETMALAQIKRRHDQEIVELEGKIRSGDTKALFVAVSGELVESSKISSVADQEAPSIASVSK
ncbi:Vacuolar membrane protease [Mortierella polycephala]|uniref:Vacuolar membrane protease n=1 Tax=Mortierella polycephala TaxID=41804 RepID=A0A9P6PL50_9FUNG|nr:Vacuolar membrane protease [Mortierella polycephala]